MIKKQAVILWIIFSIIISISVLTIFNFRLMKELQEKELLTEIFHEDLKKIHSAMNNNRWIKVSYKPSPRLLQIRRFDSEIYESESAEGILAFLKICKKTMHARLDQFGLKHTEYDLVIFENRELHLYLPEINDRDLLVNFLLSITLYNVSSNLSFRLVNEMKSRELAEYLSTSTDTFFDDQQQFETLTGISLENRYTFVSTDPTVLQLTDQSGADKFIIRNPLENYLLSPFIILHEEVVFSGEYFKSADLVFREPTQFLLKVYPDKYGKDILDKTIRKTGSQLLAVVYDEQIKGYIRFSAGATAKSVTFTWPNPREAAELLIHLTKKFPVALLINSIEKVASPK